MPFALFDYVDGSFHTMGSTMFRGPGGEVMTREQVLAREGISLTASSPAQAKIMQDKLLGLPSRYTPITSTPPGGYNSSDSWSPATPTPSPGGGGGGGSIGGSAGFRDSNFMRGVLQGTDPEAFIGAPLGSGYSYAVPIVETMPTPSITQPTVRPATGPVAMPQDVNTQGETTFNISEMTGNVYVGGGPTSPQFSTPRTTGPIMQAIPPSQAQTRPTAPSIVAQPAPEPVPLPPEIMEYMIEAVTDTLAETQRYSVEKRPFDAEFFWNMIGGMVEIPPASRIQHPSWARSIEERGRNRYREILASFPPVALAYWG